MNIIIQAELLALIYAVHTIEKIRTNFFEEKENSSTYDSMPVESVEEVILNFKKKTVYVQENSMRTAVRLKWNGDWDCTNDHSGFFQGKQYLFTFIEWGT